MKPHKHAAFIKAWADGAKIEERYKGIGAWEPFDGIWTEDDDWQCRIKPELKPDVVMYGSAIGESLNILAYRRWDTYNLKLTFDGETGKLKVAEVIA